MTPTVNQFGRVVCEVDLEPQQLDYLKRMMAQYQIPDLGKAVRVLVNHAQATVELEEQIFKKTRCRHCI
jgi:hypothetical protein